MLVNRVNLKDILTNELYHSENYLQYFEKLDTVGILKLIALGNDNCDLEEAGNILDEYLKESQNNTLISAMNELKEAYLGIHSDEKTDDSNGVAVDKFNNLSELYNYYYSQLPDSAGVTYNSFWGMNTKEVFMMLKCILPKVEKDINNKLQMEYINAALTAAAVFGKLPKEAPKVNITDKDEAVDKDGFTKEDKLNIAKIKAMIH